MLDPADCGPAFIALPQDTQELAFDYPAAFFEERLWSIPRPRPDRKAAMAQAAALLKTAKNAPDHCGWRRALFRGGKGRGPRLPPIAAFRWWKPSRARAA